MQKKLLIAVLALGFGALIYWAVRVADDAEPTATPAVPAPMDDAPTITTADKQFESPESAHDSQGAEATRPPLEPRLDETRTPISRNEQPQSIALEAQSHVEPIALPSTYLKTLERLQKLDPNVPLIKLHAQLNSEPRDPDWAYGTEQQLSAFFLSRASQLGIEVPTIACRTSGCEVLMTSTHNSAPFDELANSAQREPWFSSFELQPMLRGSDGHLAYLWMILKRR